jgi:DNA-binding response OmpR family regulator
MGPDKKNLVIQQHFSADIIDGRECIRGKKMQHSIKVLVIDDDAMIRKLLESTLSRKGFKVFAAENGLDGIDIAKAENVDIILLDWMMPEMDGMEVLAELKRNQDTMHIPVFMLTSKEDSKDIDLATSRGAIDYIIKPFNTFEVPKIVQKYLEKVHQAHSRKQGFWGKIFSRH